MRLALCRRHHAASPSVAPPARVMRGPRARGISSGEKEGVVLSDSVAG